MNNFTVHWKPILQEVTDYPNWRLYAVAVSLVITILWQYWQNTFSIPTYGGIWSFSRALSSWRFNPSGRELCLEAYAKHPIILTPGLSAWTAMAQSKYVEEISRAPDDVLSLVDAAMDFTQTRWTRGPKFLSDHYHLDVVRNQLTRNLAHVFPDLFDEIRLAVDDYAGNMEDWNTLNVFSFSLKVITRTSNRIFVGKSLCKICNVFEEKLFTSAAQGRNEQWLSLMIASAVDIMKTARFINYFPKILRPIVGWLSSSIDRRIDAAMKIGGPIIQKRIDEHYRESSNDFLAWLIDKAPEGDLNPRDIAARLISTNFVSLHGMSMALTNGLYWLMARPQYWGPLREEIEATTSRLGWTKDAIGAMVKLDSFMRESMRMNPSGTQTLGRKVLKPFTFSNGFQAPVGMTIATHLYATHHDESIYPQADEFDGFRFVEAGPSVEHGEKEKGTGGRKTMYTTSPTYLAFGHGRHACPGRFFAATEVKSVFAYLITNYDMKWPDSVYSESVPGYTAEGYRPLDVSYGLRFMPDPTPKMLIRKRMGAGGER